MPDTIIIDPSPARGADLYEMWADIGSRYAEVLEADRMYGDRSKQAERANARWFAAERKIANIKGTSPALLLMKLEMVAGTEDMNEDTGDFSAVVMRGMIRDLRAALGAAAPVRYSTLLKGDAR